MNKWQKQQVRRRVKDNNIEKTTKRLNDKKSTKQTEQIKKEQMTNGANDKRSK